MFCTNDLMKAHGRIWDVRIRRSMHADRVLRCIDDPEGLNNGHLPSGCGPQVHELANDPKHGTAVPS
jgi:hypothetical protein